MTGRFQGTAYIVGVACALASLSLNCQCGDGAACGLGTIERDGTCVPIGPDGGGDCGPGTIASAVGCVPVASPADRRLCIGRFGPVADDDPDAVYVDSAYTASDAIGTSAKPFAVLQDGLDAAAPGQVVAVAAGRYEGDLMIRKPVTVEGRCAKDVIVVGSVSVVDTGDVALRGVTITNGAPGVAASGAAPGVGTSGLELRYARLIMNNGAGLMATASHVTVRDSEILQTVSLGSDVELRGSGIVIVDGSNFDVRDSTLETNAFAGIDVADARGPPSAVTATDRLSSGAIRSVTSARNAGDGVRIRGELPAVEPAGDELPIMISSSTIAENARDGVIANAARIDVVGSTIEINARHGIVATASLISIAGNTMTGKPGGGVGVLVDKAATSVSGNFVSGFDSGGITVIGKGSELGLGHTLVFGNTVVMNSETGILLSDVENATVEANEVSRTVASRAPEQSGHGVFVRGVASSDVSSVVVRNNNVHDNGGTGICIEALLRSTDLSSVAYVVEGNTLTGNRFVAINIQNAAGGRVADNTVSDNAGYGIRALDAADGLSSAILTIIDNTISNTGSSVVGNDGDGILLVRSHVAVTGNEVSGSAGAGIVSVAGCTGDVTSNVVFDSSAADLVQEGASVTFAGNLDELGGAISELDPLGAQTFNEAYCTFPPPPTPE